MNPGNLRIHGMACLLVLACAASSPVQGAEGDLWVEYFANASLSGQPAAVGSSSRVSEDWGLGSPAGLPVDHFSVRWIAGLVPPVDGDYQLVVKTSGGVRLWLGEHRLLDDWQSETVRELTSRVIRLRGGNEQRLVLEFVDRGGPAGIELLWQNGPSDRQIVPSASLTTAGGEPGLDAAYFQGRTWTGPALMQRIDPQVAFDWQGGAPDGLMPQDGFSVRWSGYLTSPESKVLQLIARTDDGVRVRIDGQTCIDYWKDRSVSDSFSAPFAVEAGRPYRVEMEYYENGGQAVARLEWREAYSGRELIGPEHFAQAAVSGKLLASYSPYCLELPLPPAAVGVLHVDGQPVELTRASPHSAYANIPLNASEPVKLTYHIGDRRYDLDEMEWSPVDPTAVEPLLLRVGDSICIEVPPSSELDVLENSGLAAGEALDVQDADEEGSRVLYNFEHSGYFTLRTTFTDGRPVHAREVIVVGTDLARRSIAAEVGYRRHATVTSTPKAGYVHWAAVDGAELEVGMVARTDQADRIAVMPLRRGAPAIIGRLGGGSGPVLDIVEVDEFTLKVLGKDRLIASDYDGVDVAYAKVVMTPFIEDLWIELRMFAGKSTFSGGMRSVSYNTSGMGEPAAGRPPLGYETVGTMVDPVTGEIAGVLNYAVEVVDLKACHRVQVGQVNSPYEPVSASKDNNPKVCVEYCDRAATFDITAPEDVTLCVGEPLELGDPQVVQTQPARFCYRGDGCPECFERDMPAPEYTVDGLDAVDTDTPGTYVVTYTLQPEYDCIECGVCVDSVTITVKGWECVKEIEFTAPQAPADDTVCVGIVKSYAATGGELIQQARRRCMDQEKQDGSVELWHKWSISGPSGDAEGEGLTTTQYEFTHAGEHTISFISYIFCSSGCPDTCPVPEEEKVDTMTVTVEEWECYNEFNWSQPRAPVGDVICMGTKKSYTSGPSDMQQARKRCANGTILQDGSVEMNYSWEITGPNTSKKGDGLTTDEIDFKLKGTYVITWTATPFCSSGCPEVCPDPTGVQTALTTIEVECDASDEKLAFKYSAGDFEDKAKKYLGFLNKIPFVKIEKFGGDFSISGEQTWECCPDDQCEVVARKKAKGEINLTALVKLTWGIHKQENFTFPPRWGIVEFFGFKPWLSVNMDIRAGLLGDIGFKVLGSASYSHREYPCVEECLEAEVGGKVDLIGKFGVEGKAVVVPAVAEMDLKIVGEVKVPISATLNGKWFDCAKPFGGNVCVGAIKGCGILSASAKVRGVGKVGFEYTICTPTIWDGGCLF